MKKESLYNPQTWEEIRDRIESLKPGTTPEWGSMSSAQMLAHCAETQEVTNGEKPLEGTPLIARLMKRLIRSAVYGDRPYPKGSRTHPQYEQTEERDFEKEKERLLGALERFVSMEEATAAQIEHPLFGRTSREERGWGMYKHLDHHLRQFGV